MLIFGPSFVLWYYCKNFKRWEDEDFEDSMGSVLDGLNKNKKAAIGYPIIFMLRRTIVAFVGIYER